MAALNRHTAPPVVYPLGLSQVLGRWLLALWFAGLLATLGWVDGAAQIDWRMGLAFFVLFGTGMAVRRGWRRTPNGQLAWDGESWRWESSSYQTGSAEQRLCVIGDFQRVLLLRLENQSGARLWLWAERSAMPERWMDLRRAVYSPRRLPAGARQRDMRDEPPQELALISGDGAPNVVPGAKTPLIRS